jgi:hypothetical protein
MDFLLKYAPLLNLGLILAAGAFTIWRVGYVMQRFERVIDAFEMALKGMDARLVQLETAHHLHHPGELRPQE